MCLRGGKGKGNIDPGEQLENQYSNLGGDDERQWGVRREFRLKGCYGDSTPRTWRRTGCHGYLIRGHLAT